MMKTLFIGSSVSLLCLPDSGMVPAAGEDNVRIDWTLPMTPASQELLFTRITQIVEQPSDRKRYRLTKEELVSLRNIVCLYTQVRDFMSERITEFAEYDKLMTTSNLKDQDFAEMLEARPSTFSLSMLPSAKRQALEQARVQEEGQTLEAEQERLSATRAGSIFNPLWSGIGSFCEASRKLQRGWKL